MSATALPWSCRCGAMGGTLRVERGSGTPGVCHCDSCVRAQNHFGVVATRVEGVAIFQTTPDRVTVAQGAEHLALARLSPKGAYRWHAACCNSQIGVTSTTPKFAFVGLVQTLFSDTAPLGRARCHAYVPQSGGGEKHSRLMPSIMAVLSRSVAALTSGRWRQTPFFDVATGEPVASPTLLTKDAGKL